MKVEALMVLALDRLVLLVKRADHSVLSWSGCALNPRIQTLHHPLASHTAPPAGLPVLPSARIDSLGLRCRAQLVGAVVVSAPCRNRARCILMGICAAMV
ncbi:hypothetical protein ACKWRH_05890 [Bradyrhizobium sp. Pa8]|uniref:hypothetical protein n=1 Tax=Bradyrhizobium sp. Pa8 TaxID=3386552 RepID=UPI00403FC212